MNIGNVSWALLVTHAAYWILGLLTALAVRRLRLRLERIARDLDAALLASESDDAPNALAD